MRIKKPRKYKSKRLKNVLLNRVVSIERVTKVGKGGKKKKFPSYCCSR
jgi:ribosomal protein S5